MTDKAQWQGGVGRNWADAWQRTDITFSELTPRLLAAIAAEPGRRIVDVGCGAGEVAIAIALARPDTCVTGVDVSPDLVEAAQARASGMSGVSFVLANAAEWIAPDGAPDLYISRHGVMFFDDPPTAFAHLAASASPGARFVFSCFRSASENAWASAIAGLLSQAPEPETRPFAPGPFAFAEPDHVRLCMAGWRDVAFAPVDFSYIAGTGPNAVAEAMALFRRIGPAASAMRTLPEPDRADFESRLLELVEAHCDGEKVAFPAAAWLVTATSDYSHG
ncbi:class I SAM-dependent methyltransferase [Novosphingobium sp. CECT 9465]|uniref:class I SAM-dependent methyltransferase n=1 Tax=Novosphingobium sp. CECT 9465 TaxID=2829794 RepID=UPI001E391F15|nr:class I SAM-dependent methyltransferase [Novosphingobium sp. CECT 9465]CAH0497397.1 Trans-aconitate 2-methyltransferase [Novosphingobium sp. CECT 9465]